MKKVLVTGGTQGVGLETTKLLLDQGYVVHITYRRSAGKAEELMAEYPGRLFAHKLDQGKLEEIEEVIPPLLSFPDLPDCTIRESEANIEVYPDRARVSRTAQITYTVPDDPPEVGGDILSVEPGADGYIVSTKAKTFALEISAEDLEQNAAAD